MTTTPDPIVIRFGKADITLNPGENLLDAFERHEIRIDASCRSGVCQACLMRATAGKPPVKAQNGLKETLKQQGFFLACQCYPDSSLTCSKADAAAFQGETTIEAITRLSPDVLQVRCKRPENLAFYGGQFLNFHHPQGWIRSYSIASIPTDGPSFDIHVRRITDGKMSTWFHDQATPGDRLKISGPRGDCFYAADVDAHETLILAGTGTGIAPLYALLREALNAGHKGQIWLYHGGLSEDRLYLVAELTELANTYHQVHYLPCVLKGSDSSQFRHGNLNELVLSDLTQSQPNRAYLCGDPDLVYDLRKKLFLAGLALQKIQADAFIGTKGR